MGTIRLQDVLCWRDAALELSLRVDDDGVARVSVAASAEPSAAGPSAAGPAAAREPSGGEPGLHLLDLMVAGQGRAWAGLRYSESSVGQRMRYVSHELSSEGPWSTLEVVLHDPVTGLAAAVLYRRLDGAGVLQSSVLITNEGSLPQTIESVSSLLVGGLAGPGGDLQEVEVMWAENDWQAEFRWRRRDLRDALPQIAQASDGRSRGRFAITSVGSWSSGTYLPMGAVSNRRTGHTMVWQIEHNGAWQWQVGEHRGGERASLSYLAALGPTDVEHHWRATLAPGESLASVPAALSLAAGGFEAAVAQLTRYRRAIRREHLDNRRLPVIFNDYMLTLMGDPSTERLLPLISAAASAGAECFCIDAGWYAEPAEEWWDSVGEWAPARTRFSGGLREVLESIRAHGMVPGLWIEPEVIGVRSPVADELPEQAFFMRDGRRVVEQGRYHLDLRHPAARAHLDRAVGSLVEDLGVGYLKMDYNIDVGPGTDVGGVEAGVGLLAHNRALLAWIDDILERHPQLTLEACSSGAMRADYATLSHFQLQSTSDQEDPLLYPPIAVAAAVALTPEQAGVWTPVQPEMSDELIVFTLCTGLLGRLYLSGHLDEMTPAQQRLVADAVSVYKRIRAEVADAVPFWPLGLPSWDDDWLAFGLRGAHATYVSVFRRKPGGAGADDATMRLPIAGLDAATRAAVIYPDAEAVARWEPEGRELVVVLPRAPSACLVAL